MFSQDFEEESETKIYRSAKRNGIKVIEEYRKNRNKSNIQYMENDRFFIKGSGTNMDLDETWDAIKKFDTEDLSS
jgi:BRCT domain type II-containing protein